MRKSENNFSLILEKDEEILVKFFRYFNEIVK